MDCGWICNKLNSQALASHTKFTSNKYDTVVIEEYGIQFKCSLGGYSNI